MTASATRGTEQSNRVRVRTVTPLQPTKTLGLRTLSSHKMAIPARKNLTVHKLGINQIIYALKVAGKYSALHYVM